MYQDHGAGACSVAINIGWEGPSWHRRGAAVTAPASTSTSTGRCLMKILTTADWTQWLVHTGPRHRPGSRRLYPVVVTQCPLHHPPPPPGSVPPQHSLMATNGPLPGYSQAVRQQLVVSQPGAALWLAAARPHHPAQSQPIFSFCAPIVHLPFPSPSLPSDLLNFQISPPATVLDLNDSIHAESLWVGPWRRRRHSAHCEADTNPSLLDFLIFVSL